MPPDDRGRLEMRKRAQRMSPQELDEITRIWLAGVEAAEQGDSEIRGFINGMFGPWASELLRLRRN